MKMEQIECSETSVYKIETPGNYPKGNILYSEHGESLKLRITIPFPLAERKLYFIRSVQKGSGDHSNFSKRLTIIILSQIYRPRYEIRRWTLKDKVKNGQSYSTTQAYAFLEYTSNKISKCKVVYTQGDFKNKVTDTLP